MRAYYGCAYSRFVDVIGQGIELELFESIRNDLGEELTKGLELDCSDGMYLQSLIFALYGSLQVLQLNSDARCY